MPPDKQLIEIFKSLFPAGDRRVRGDHFTALFPGLRLHLSAKIHLIFRLTQDLTIDVLVILKPGDFPYGQKSSGGDRDHQSRRNRRRKNKAGGRRYTCRSHEQSEDNPSEPSQLIFIGDLSCLFIAVQGDHHDQQLAPATKNGIRRQIHSGTPLYRPKNSENGRNPTITFRIAYV